MELGISPLFTSSMFLGLIVNNKIITYDKNVALDAKLMEQLEKLLGMIVSLCTAIIYVTTGMYGSLNEIGLYKAILIIL
jgi:protein transport protein SEC61 subunit alpha